MGMYMGRTRGNPNERYVNSIQCPVDLDSLIMLPNCTPEFIEENLSIGDDILYDAIRMSVNSSWLLKLDVFSKFTDKFKSRLVANIDAFPRLSSTYFGIMAEVCEEEKLGTWDFGANKSDIVGLSQTKTFNPFTMLGNDMVDLDRTILSGRTTLREMLLVRIKKFLTGADKSLVNFAYSLFLPELLSPKFFNGLSEAEHVVILCSMENYFDFVKKFSMSSFGLRSASARRKELNQPICLLKHVLSSDWKYTDRVRMIAWKQLYKEIDKLKKTSMGVSKAYAILDLDESTRETEAVKQKMAKQGWSSNDIQKWVVDADGLFEAFELDCTLHNMDATDFFIPLLCSDMYKLVDGMVNFQDVDVRNKMFNRLSECLSAFK